MPLLNAQQPVERSGPVLASRRSVLLQRIQSEREHTVEIGRCLADDLRATERTRHTILVGLKVVRLASIAGGVFWSFNAASRLGRGRRLLALAISVLSTIRVMRKAGDFLRPLLSASATSPPTHLPKNLRPPS